MRRLAAAAQKFKQDSCAYTGCLLFWASRQQTAFVAETKKRGCEGQASLVVWLKAKLSGLNEIA